MKLINFIHTLNHKEQHNIILWYRISCVLVSAMVLGLVIISWRQHRQLNTAYQEWHVWKTKTDALIAGTKEYELLKKQEQELRARKTLVHSITSQQKQIADYFTTLAHINKDNALHTITIYNNNIELCAECKNNQAATALLKTMEQSKQFSHVRINALNQNDGGKLLVTIKGTTKA